MRQRIRIPVEVYAGDPPTWKRYERKWVEIKPDETLHISVDEPMLGHFEPPESRDDTWVTCDSTVAFSRSDGTTYRAQLRMKPADYDRLLGMLDRRWNTELGAALRRVVDRWGVSISDPDEATAWTAHRWTTIAGLPSEEDGDHPYQFRSAMALLYWLFEKHFERPFMRKQAFAEPPLTQQAVVANMDEGDSVERWRLPLYDDSRVAGAVERARQAQTLFVDTALAPIHRAWHAPAGLAGARAVGAARQRKADELGACLDRALSEEERSLFNRFGWGIVADPSPYAVFPLLPHPHNALPSSFWDMQLHNQAPHLAGMEHYWTFKLVEEQQASGGVRTPISREERQVSIIPTPTLTDHGAYTYPTLAIAILVTHAEWYQRVNQRTGSQTSDQK